MCLIILTCAHVDIALVADDLDLGTAGKRLREILSELIAIAENAEFKIRIQVCMQHRPVLVIGLPISTSDQDEVNHEDNAASPQPRRSLCAPSRELTRHEL